MKKRQKYYVVIPAWNEEPRVAKVIKEVKKYTSNIIIVDDGSSDRTSEVAAKNGGFVLRHRLNLGKGAAMKTGAEAAFNLGADVVVFIDADGQHPPKHIPEFLDKINQGYKIVFGSRNLSYGVPLVRYLGNKIGSVLISLIFGIYRSDMLCGFLAFTREVYPKIRWERWGRTRYGVETEIVARTGKNKLKYAEIPIETIYIDKYKGVTILNTIEILFSIPEWLIS
ncbi:MAG: glycosyltransferase family 2 protein [bacterium]|nr:glycosyltransferase family 2 protein [bacterium]